jgi:hypothetical protein
MSDDVNRMRGRLRTLRVDHLLDDRPAVASAPVVAPTTRAPRALPILGVWCAVVVAARVVGRQLVVDGAHLRLPFPPLDATLDWRPGWGLLWAGGVGIAAVGWAPRLARTCSWRVLLVGSTVLGAAWAASLALLDGAHGIVGSVALKNEYYLDVDRVRSPIAFLSGFVDHLEEYRVHVQGHPPGYLLVVWALDQVGLGSVSTVAVMELAVGALAIPAVLVAVREVAGGSVARAAAPFVAVAPVAFFAGVGAWAVTLVVLATGRRDRRGDAYALAGGLLFGITAFLSYGLVLLAVIPIAVAIPRRRWRPLVLAAIAVSSVFVMFAVAGFWWFDGLAATRTRYFAGVASRRPYLQFLLVNLACFAIALGPVLAVALARLRDRRVWLLVGGSLVAVAGAGISGMSKGEVERIWLPFAMWVLPAAVAIGLGRRRSQWLAVQVVFTIVLQTLVRSPW